VDLYEHQGKELFARYDIPVPRGIVATTAEDAARATEELGGRSVVKIQVQVGGRGKGELDDCYFLGPPLPLNGKLYALVDRADGSRVRVISASAQWPVRAVRRSLSDG